MQAAARVSCDPPSHRARTPCRVAGDTSREKRSGRGSQVSGSPSARPMGRHGEPGASRAHHAHVGDEPQARDRAHAHAVHLDEIDASCLAGDQRVHGAAETRRQADAAAEIVAAAGRQRRDDDRRIAQRVDDAMQRAVAAGHREAPRAGADDGVDRVLKFLEVGGIEKVRLDVRRKERVEGGLEASSSAGPRRRRHDHRQQLG